MQFSVVSRLSLFHTLHWQRLARLRCLSPGGYATSPVVHALMIFTPCFFFFFSEGSRMGAYVFAGVFQTTHIYLVRKKKEHGV